MCFSTCLLYFRALRISFLGELPAGGKNSCLVEQLSVENLTVACSIVILKRDKSPVVLAPERTSFKLVPTNQSSCI